MEIPDAFQKLEIKQDNIWFEKKQEEYGKIK